MTTLLNNTAMSLDNERAERPGSMIDCRTLPFIFVFFSGACGDAGTYGRPCHVCPKYRVVAICADGYRIGNYQESRVSASVCGAGAKAENPCPAEVKQEMPLPRVEWLH
jgi:hypothetical protein